MSYYQIESRYVRLIDSLRWASHPHRVDDLLSKLRDEYPIEFGQIKQAHDQAIADLGGAA